MPKTTSKKKRPQVPVVVAPIDLSEKMVEQIACLIIARYKEGRRDA